MKKLLPFLAILLTISELHSQTPISVYDCNALDPLVTPQDFQNSNPEFYKPCILFAPSNTYSFNGTTNKTIKAATEIHIQDGFHAGAHTGNGQTHLQIMPKSDFEVVSMNYPDLNGILKLKKFEIGIKLPLSILEQVNNYLFDQPGGKINPFMEDEIDVEIKFKHQSTGIEKSIDCFYYRDFVRNTAINDWVDVENSYVIRGRFAPPLIGKWEAYVTIDVNGTQVAEATPFVFNVIESGDKGFVKIHENLRNLQQGDRIIFPVGHNLVGPYVGTEVWTQNPADVNKAAKLDDWLGFLNNVSTYGNLGGKFIRLGQYPFSGLIEFAKLGNYYDRLHYAWEYDHVLDICEEKDILTEFNLLWHTPIMKVGDAGMAAWDFYTESYFVKYCYNDENILGPNPEPKDMFTNSTMLEYHKQRNRYYISRYGYSTKIYEFQLLSEPWHLNQIAEQQEPIYQGDVQVQNALYTYHTEMANYIKEHLGHTEHLLGCDIAPKNWSTNSAPFYVDQSVYNNNIDVINVNSYDNKPQKQIVSKLPNTDNNLVASNETSCYAQYQHLQLITGKPVILSENGHAEGNVCSNYVGHFIDVMTQGFNGCAGFMMWDGIAYPPFGDDDQREICWPATIRAQEHYNANDFINTLSNGGGQWVQGRQTESFKDFAYLKESQYYVSHNKELAVGYIRNRTHNERTYKINDDCLFGFDSQYNTRRDIPNTGHKMWVEGLKKNTDYRIDWYNYKEGDYVFSQCQSTQDTNLRLNYPTLTSNYSYITDDEMNPIWWYVIYQENCAQHSEIVNSEEVNPVGELVNLSEEQNSYPDVSVHPNPFTDNLIIVTPVKETVYIINPLGVAVDEFRLNEGENVLVLSHLRAGVYYLQFRTQDLIEKVVKINNY